MSLRYELKQQGTDVSWGVLLGLKQDPLYEQTRVLEQTLSSLVDDVQVS